MTLPKTLPRDKWSPFHFWRQNEINKAKRYLKFPEDLVLLWHASSLENEVPGNKNPFLSSVLGPQYTRNADGSYTNAGAVAPVDVIGGRKMLRTCGAVTNLFSGDASIARSVTLTAQAYTLQVFGAGSVTCSYGTATVGNPLTFTATAGSVTFTPTGATLWMLTASAYPLPYTPPGTTMPASHATTTNGPWFGLPQYDDAETSDGLFKRDGVELVVNGGFDSDTVWSKGTGWSIENGVAINTTGAWELISQSGLIVGQRYIVEFDIVSGSGRLAVRLGTTNTIGTATGVGRHKVEGVCVSNTTVAFLWETLGGSIDNISIQKLIPATKTNKVWAALDGEPDGVEVWSNAGASGTNWALSNGAWTHTAGSTAALSLPSVVTIGQRYVARYTVTGRTAGSITAQAGSSGTGGAVITTNGTVVEVETCAGSTNMLFVPSSDFNGTVTVLSIQRIQPKPMTLAWRGVMGVGSGDYPQTTYSNPAYVSGKAQVDDILAALCRNDGNQQIVRSRNINSTYVANGDYIEWDRNTAAIIFVQVSSDGLRIRAGYYIIGVSTNVWWSIWSGYTGGTTGPSTLYKLLLGYGNTYPLWHDTIALWNKQIDDATLLKEMLK